jgi:hypothetical protein
MRRLQAILAVPGAFVEEFLVCKLRKWFNYQGGERRAVVRYSLGVTPVSFLNTVQK